MSNEESVLWIGYWLCVLMLMSMSISVLHSQYTDKRDSFALWLFLTATPILNIIVMWIRISDIRKWKKYDEYLQKKVVK
jgi:hypothetical protein